jgi:hypothetical protein
MGNRFLNMFGLTVLNQTRTLPKGVIDAAWQLIRFHMFVRQQKRPFLLTDGRYQQLLESPISSDFSDDNVRTGPPFPRSIMRLRVEADGTWRDANLAMITLQLAALHRSPDRLRFALTIVSFLANRNYDYLTTWTLQLNLSELGQEEYRSEIAVYNLKAFEMNKRFFYSDPAPSVDRAFAELEKLFSVIDFVILDKVARVADRRAVSDGKNDSGSQRH